MTKEHAEFIAERVPGAVVHNFTGAETGYSICSTRSLLVNTVLTTDGELKFCPISELELLNGRINRVFKMAIDEAKRAGFQ